MTTQQQPLPLPPKKTPDTHAIVAGLGVVAGTLLLPVEAAVDELSQTLLNAPLDAAAVTIVSSLIAFGLAVAVIVISRVLGIAPSAVEAEVEKALRLAPIVYKVESLHHHFTVQNASVPPQGAADDQAPVDKTVHG